MSSDERVARIIGDWIEQRDEGVYVDPERICGEHEDVAGELRARFAALNLVERAYAEESELPQDAPQTIGEYRIIRELGRGGMGVVYEAEQTSLERRVALKVLSTSITGVAQAVKRFHREAKAAARLHHTNIVPVYGLSSYAGQWFYAMELVEGFALSDVVSNLRKPNERALACATLGLSDPSHESRSFGTEVRSYFVRVAEMFAGVADALELAHQEGIIHRDIKPSNLLLDADGVLKIVDFGLARFADENLGLTMTGDLLATPIYMSPEQAMAKRAALDHRTDIYSLGATLYEVLTLRPPFDGKNLQELCSQIIAKDPVRPRRTNKRVPRDLETIVLKAMEKDRDKRYPNARAMARDLRAFAEGSAIRARPIGPVARTWRIAKRHKVRSILAASVVVLACSGGLLWLRAAQETKRRMAFEYTTLCARGHEARLAQGATLAGIDLTLGDEDGEFFSEAISLEPDRAEAYLGRALARARSQDERLADMEAARARGLTLRSYHLGRAAVFATTGLGARAEEEQKIADATEAAGPVDHLIEGRLLSMRGEFVSADAAFSQALAGSEEGSPLRFLAHRERANVRAQTGDDDGTLTDLLAAHAGGDRSILTRVRIAALWRRIGRAELARKWLDEVRESVRAASDERSWLLLARALLDADECEDLDQVAQEVRKSDPQSPALVVPLVWAMISGGEPLADALRATEAGLSRDPGHRLLLRLKAFLLTQLGRGSEAVTVAESAMRETPGDRFLALYLASGLFSIDRRVEAIEMLQAVLTQDPFWADGHAALSGFLRSEGRIAEALAACDAALRVRPRNPYVIALKGNILHHKGNNDEALELCDRAVEMAGVNAWFATVHVERGQLLQILGRPRAALESLDHALGMRRDLWRAWGRKAYALLDLGKPEEALAAANRAHELRPHSGPVCETRGAVLMRLGRDEEAIAAFKRALPTYDVYSVHHNLGTALSKCGRIPEAIAAWRQALARKPPTSVASVLHANLATRLSDPSEGLREANTAIALDPKNALAHAALGSALHRLGRFKEALHALERACAADPKNAEYKVNRGKVLLELCQLPAALEAFNRALELDPKLAEAHASRGTTLWLLGDHREAREACDRALELGPGLVNVLVHHAGMLIEERRYAEATTVVERALALDARNARAFRLRASALLHLGQNKEALAAARDSLALDATRAITHCDQGLALMRLQRYSDSVEAYRRAIRIDPRLPNAWVNMGVGLSRLRHAKRALEAFDRALALDEKYTVAHVNRGFMLLNLGQAAEGWDALELAVHLGYPQASLARRVALERANSSDPQIRDPARAVPLARRAVELAPKDGMSWTALGVALCSSRQWREGLEAHQHAMRIRGSNALDGFHVAMAKHNLGHKDARESFDKAVAWMEENKPGDEELKRFRAEAEEVLGIKDK